MTFQEHPNALVRARIDAGLTQAELAILAHMTQRRIVRAETEGWVRESEAYPIRQTLGGTRAPSVFLETMQGMLSGRVRVRE
jgi:DNA-binding XRE family transcriptional regulator